MISVESVNQLGRMVRATRRAQQLRLDDTAGAAGVGHVFVRDVEHVKPTVRLGRVLQLAELGIEFKAEVPDAAWAEYQRLQATGLKPLKTRSR